MGKTKDNKHNNHRQPPRRGSKNDDGDADPDNDAGDVVEDARFDSSKLHFRQRTTTTSGKEQQQSYTNNNKVILDERFASVLTDPRFQVLDIQDKYGRQNKKGAKKKGRDQKVSAQAEQLGAFYTLADEDSTDKQAKDENDDKEKAKDAASSDESDSSSSDNSDDDDGEAVEKKKQQQKRHAAASKKDDQQDASDDDNDTDPASRIAYLTALSRGEIDMSSSSSSSDDSSNESSSNSSDEDSSSDDDDDDNMEADDPMMMGKAGILDPSSSSAINNNDEAVADDAELTYEPSTYLAVLNLDWSHVRAVDIFVLLSSFTPPHVIGGIKRVQVFPSDYGLEKMERDALLGPPTGVWKKSKTTKKSLVENEEEEVGKEQIARYESEDNDDDKNDDDDDDDDDDDGASGGGSEQDGSNADGPSLQRREDTKEATTREYKNTGETDFDPEKLRAYEASKLKYYFAVAEFHDAQCADAAYREVDGMEFEHSSAAVDLRSIPVHDIPNVIKNRELRDEATSIPSNYEPPEFVVAALQQSAVQCTWDSGDRDRERLLTSHQNWNDDIVDRDDLKAYLASDNSSDEEEENSDQETEKALQMRKMLGLDSDDDDVGDKAKDISQSADQDQIESSSDSGSEDDGDVKEVEFIPGKPIKIADREADMDEKPKELTPWEKYQEKRKQKRREKRQAAREKRKQVNATRKGGTSSKPNDDDDDFFMDDDKHADDNDGDRFSTKPTKEQLELLVAGDDEAEEARDFDMRGLERMEKNKDKKLRGARKRKEDKLAAGVVGTAFQIDVTDERFKAVVDGTDERFGIDRTDPNFKETSGMRDLLSEQQTRRRRHKKRKGDDKAAELVVAPNVNAETTNEPSSGAAALSALVSSIKSKVNQ